MGVVWKIFDRGKKGAGAPAGPALARDRDFTRPEHFSVNAARLILSQAELEQAFEDACNKARNGEPYGIALYMRLIQSAHNHQAVADLVDELPNWAFGSEPTDDFATMLHAWAINTKVTPKERHTEFMRFAVLAGWRPGDANAYWWEREVIEGGEHIRRSKHFFAFDLIAGTLTVGETELGVAKLLLSEADRIQAEQNP